MRSERVPARPAKAGRARISSERREGGARNPQTIVFQVALGVRTFKNLVNRPGGGETAQVPLFPYMARHLYTVNPLVDYMSCVSYATYTQWLTEWNE